MVFVLSRCRYGTIGSSVKGMFHGDNFSPIFPFHHSIFSAQFQGSFYGLCTTITEKYLVKITVCRQSFRQCNLIFRIIKIGAVNQPFRLFSYGFGKLRMMVSQTIHSNACYKIQILFSIHIPDIHPFSVVKGHRKTVVRMHHYFASPIGQFFHFC